MSSRRDAETRDVEWRQAVLERLTEIRDGIQDLVGQARKMARQQRRVEVLAASPAAKAGSDAARLADVAPKCLAGAIKAIRRDLRF